MKYPDAAAVIRRGAHKLEGLENLGGIMGFEVGDIAEIGDGLNDLEMHSGVKLSLTVDNAEPEVKELVCSKQKNGFISQYRAGEGFLEFVQWGAEEGFY